MSSFLKRLFADANRTGFLAPELQVSNPPTGVIVTCVACQQKNRLHLRARQGFQRCGACSTPLPRSRIILCDVSGSMSEAAGKCTKIDLLREALAHVIPRNGHWNLIAFSSFAQGVETQDALPEPSGGTALHLGIESAAALAPEQTLIISDGQPDSDEAAFAALDRLSGVVDVIYVGPDGDHEAIGFMNELARRGGGRAIFHDLVAKGGAGLLPAVQTLMLPSRSG